MSFAGKLQGFNKLYITQSVSADKFNTEGLGYFCLPCLAWVFTYVKQDRQHKLKSLLLQRSLGQSIYSRDELAYCGQLGFFLQKYKHLNLRNFSINERGVK